MLVKTLHLNDYRNYSRKTVHFDPHLNIIIGRNGTGKTNILEAILVTSNSRSFRSSDDSDLIRRGQDFARIRLSADEGEFKVVINRKGKSLFINDMLIRKTSEFIGKLNAVLFKPSDLELFTQSPKERRRLLDIELSKISDYYMKALLSYNSLLKDKNRLLKEEDPDPILLDLINQSMEPLIRTIVEERDKFFLNINRDLSAIFTGISDKQSELNILYRKCSETDEIHQQLEQTKEKDRFYRYAFYGPHHDDYGFTMDGIELNSIASQGQKRMALIAFKFALVRYIQNCSGKTPIILLDDILSELDRQNQERLLRIIPDDAQVIITNTDINGLHIERNYQLIELKEEENV